MELSRVTLNFAAKRNIDLYISQKGYEETISIAIMSPEGEINCSSIILVRDTDKNENFCDVRVYDKSIANKMPKEISLFNGDFEKTIRKLINIASKGEYTHQWD